jgi:serine/threonine protein phosphatase PrpC
MQIETIYDNGVGPVNEDSLFTANPLFGVFDGASGVEPYTTADGKTGAAIASSIASSVFSSGTKSLIELVHDANDAIRSAMEKARIDTSRKAALWATSGTIIKINEETFDWLRIGDCLMLVMLRDGSFNLFANESSPDTDSLLMWQELASKKTENIRELLSERMIQVRNRVNIDYGDLNGEQEMEKFLKQGTIPLANVAHIILFTDGLLLPKEDPREPEDFNSFIDLYREGGLQRVQDFVRQKEDSDPNCWKYPRFKQHDDIAAIALTF